MMLKKGFKIGLTEINEPFKDVGKTTKSIEALTYKTGGGEGGGKRDQFRPPGCAATSGP